MPLSYLISSRLKSMIGCAKFLGMCVVCGCLLFDCLVAYYAYAYAYVIVGRCSLLTLVGR